MFLFGFVVMLFTLFDFTAGFAVFVLIVGFTYFDLVMPFRGVCLFLGVVDCKIGFDRLVDVLIVLWFVEVFSIYY